jgi:hypothetical protein
MPPIADCVAWYFNHLTLLTTLTGIFAFIVALVVDKDEKGFSNQTIARAATWCPVPNGIAFLVCSADTSYVAKITDPTTAFFMGGLAIIYVFLCDLKVIWKERGAKAA